MQAGTPRAAGGEPESRARLRGSSCARTQYFLESTSREGKRDAQGTSGPERVGEKGHEPGRPKGSPHERGRGGGEARTPGLPGAARSPAQPRSLSPVATERERPAPQGRRLGRDESGFFFFFSQCVVQAWPLGARVRGRGPARPEPAGVTQGRAPLVPLPAPASSAHESPGPAAIPPRCGSARRLRPRRAPGLGRRGPSHCDTAAPARACAAAAACPRPPRRRHSPAFPWCLKGSGNVFTWSLSPGPG